MKFMGGLLRIVEQFWMVSELREVDEKYGELKASQCISHLHHVKFMIQSVSISAKSFADILDSDLKI